MDWFRRFYVGGGRNFGSKFISVVKEPGMKGSALLGHVINRGITVVDSIPRAAQGGVRKMIASSSSRVIFVSAPKVRGPRAHLGSFVLGDTCDAFGRISLILFVIGTTRGEKTNSGFVLRGLGGLHAPGFLIVGGVSRIGPRRLLGVVVSCASSGRFGRIVPVSTVRKGGISRVVIAVGGCVPRKPRFCPSSRIASRPRCFIISRFVHRGVLRLAGRRIPRSITIIIRSVLHGRSSGIRMRTAVVISHADRGNVVVNGNKGVLGRVNIHTHHSVRTVLNSGVCLRL